MHPNPNGLLLVVKRDCPTCTLIEPVIEQLANSNTPLTIYSQDDPNFPALPGVIDDSDLEKSYHLNLEFVPTLIHLENGIEVERIFGWNRSQWQAFTGIDQLGSNLPEQRPGCGSRTVEPGVAEELSIRFGGEKLRARRIELATLEDEMEACFERGWTDGLPVVPPTRERVLRMLEGTTRPPDEVVGIIPPNQAECTVEKVAINAVLAGCKPEYLPVVLAAVEASCIDAFCMHGILATTWFSGPVVIVNGPITKAIGMNSGVNALGQGNRANATIGRALQLVIRNVGGGRPGEVDRSCMGNPGKYTFCFAENEEESPWEPLSVEQGYSPQTSTVTLFAGDGLHGISDQLSRDPESLCRTYAASLRVVGHPKLAMASDAILLVSPEHGRVFREAGWTKARLQQELDELLLFPRHEMVRRSGGISEGIPEHISQERIPKFRPGGLHIVHVGGRAGLFSAVISGWLGSGPKGSQSVTKEITE